MITADEVLTVEDAAVVVRAKPIRVRRLCASGQLAAKKDGTRWLIRRAAIEAYLEPDNQGPALVEPPVVFETAAERRRAQQAS